MNITIYGKIKQLLKDYSTDQVEFELDMGLYQNIKDEINIKVTCYDTLRSFEAIITIENNRCRFFIKDNYGLSQEHLKDIANLTLSINLLIK